MNFPDEEHEEEPLKIDKARRMKRPDDPLSLIESEEYSDDSDDEPGEVPYEEAKAPEPVEEDEPVDFESLPDRTQEMDYKLVRDRLKFAAPEPNVLPKPKPVLEVKPAPRSQTGEVEIDFDLLEDGDLGEFFQAVTHDGEEEVRGISRENIDLLVKRLNGVTGGRLGKDSRGIMSEHQNHTTQYSGSKPLLYYPASYATPPDIRIVEGSKGIVCIVPGTSYRVSAENEKYIAGLRVIRGMFRDLDARVSGALVEGLSSKIDFDPDTLELVVPKASRRYKRADELHEESVRLKKAFYGNVGGLRYESSGFFGRGFSQIFNSLETNMRSLVNCVLWPPQMSADFMDVEELLGSSFGVDLYVLFVFEQIFGGEDSLKVHGLENLDVSRDAYVRNELYDAQVVAGILEDRTRDLKDLESLKRVKKNDVDYGQYVRAFREFLEERCSDLRALEKRYQEFLGMSGKQEWSDVAETTRNRARNAADRLSEVKGVYMAMIRPQLIPAFAKTLVGKDISYVTLPPMDQVAKG